VFQIKDKNILAKTSGQTSLKTGKLFARMSGIVAFHKIEKRYYL